MNCFEFRNYACIQWEMAVAIYMKHKASYILDFLAYGIQQNTDSFNFIGILVLQKVLCMVG